MAAVALEEDGGLHPASEVALKMLLAGLSNGIASTVTNPADLVKVRQQLYVKQAGQTFAPSFFTTLVRMVRSEGFLSIYKGLSASMCREMSYSGIRMGTYDFFKTTIHSAAPQVNVDSVSVKLLAGLGSGCLGAAIANPCDLVKVRMQAAGATLGLRAQFRAVVAERGFAGLYRAVGPTTFRAGLLTASQMGSYDIAKTYLRNHYAETFPEGLKTHLLCSGIAGFVCSAVSAPVDVIKVRVMNDTQKHYKNALHAAGLLLRYEGPTAFYKGFFGCFARLWPHTIVSLLIFERFRALAGLKAI